MKNIKTFLFLILIVLFYGCTSTYVQPKSETINVNLSQLADISTCEEASLREINIADKEGVNTNGIMSAVIVLDSSIIYHTTNYAYLLDREGNLIRKIGDKGKAGNEYLFIKGITVDSNSILLNDFRNKVLEFDRTGAFVAKYDISSTSSYIFSQNNKLMYTQFDPKLTKSNLKIVDKVNQTAQDIAIPFDYFSRFIGSCKYGDEVIYSALPRFIYTANDQFEFKERYIIDYGQLNPHDEKQSRLTREQMDENVSSRANFGGAIHETDLYFYFDTIYKDELIVSKYDKKTKECTSYRIPQSSGYIEPYTTFHNGVFSYIVSRDEGIIIGFITFK